MPKTFRQALLDFLDGGCMKLPEIAERSGVSLEQLKKVRQRAASSTNVEDAFKVANACGFSLDEFLADATRALPQKVADQYNQSQFTHGCQRGMGVDESEVFRENLLRIMAEKGFDAATLSRAAKLNPRAVKDIEERRSVSPKLSTIFKLATALSVDPTELIGLKGRPRLAPELADYLAQYSEEDQRKLLAALAALPLPKP
jgi:transcriptional regulator with XRE-family HTH domain